MPIGRRFPPGFAEITLPADNDYVLVYDTSGGVVGKVAVSSLRYTAPIVPLASRWVFDGDSITVQGSTGYTGAAESLVMGGAWPRAFAAASDGRVEYVWNAGVGGDTSADRLAAFDTDVAPYNPEVVLLTVGTNDIGESVPMATWLSNLGAYRDKCVAIGARLVVGEIWPTDSNTPAGRQATTLTWNAALADWAGSFNVPLIPWNQLVGVTGGWPVGWSLDGIHPENGIPKATIGKLGWSYISYLVDPDRFVARPEVNSADHLTNGLMETLGSSIGPPVGLGSAVSGTGGTLATATYDYVVSVHDYFGESPPSAATTIAVTLGEQVDLTWTQVTGRRGYSVYRRVSGVGAYKRIAVFDASQIATSTYSDIGAAAGTIEPATVNTTARPTGALQSTASRIHERATDEDQFYTEAGVNGRIYRMMPFASDPATAPSVWLVADAVTAGEVYDISIRCRYVGSTSHYPRLLLRFDPTTVTYTICDILPLVGTDWHLIHGRVTVPSGKTSMRFILSGTTGITHIDWAEPKIELVP